MALDKIGVGAVANDRTGDTWRAAWIKANKLIPADPASDLTFALSGLNELVDTADLSTFSQWAFDPSISMTDPGVGEFRLNNVDMSLATEISISDLTRNGMDVSPAIELVQQNSTIIIKKHNDLNTWLQVQIGFGGAIDGSGFFTAPIEVVDSGSGSFSEGDTVEFNFIGHSGLVRVIPVNSLDDLPAPIGTKIEIGGGIFTYEFSALGVDLGPNTLLITGGVVVLKGSNRYTSQLSSTSTNALVEVVGAFYADEFMNFSNPNGPIYDYDGDGLAQAAFVSQNHVIRDCTTIGTIKDANTISLRTPTVVTTSVGGFTFEGTGLFQCNISLALGFTWTGTLIDWGTSTWDIINLTQASRFISPSGTITLAGDPGAGNNLTANGRAFIDGNLFNGPGTALSNIDTQDPQWRFTANEFADGTTQNTRIDGDTALFPASPPQVVTIGSIGVYVAIGGSEWVADLQNHFTFDSAGIGTYTGLEREDVEVIAKATLTKVGGGSDLICAKIAVDTGSGFVEVEKSIGCTESASPTQVVCDAILTLSTGDKIQLFVGNEDSTANIEITNATLAIKA
ncbi:MAG: hypothetical protein V3V40_06560 [Nitrosomonadaceae bacterium]